MMSAVIPQGSTLTNTVYCIQCANTSCTHVKVIFKTSIRCEGTLVHRVGIHSNENKN